MTTENFWIASRGFAVSNHWAWISGWAIAPDQFHSAAVLAFPGYRHTVHAPTVEAIDAILQSAPDRIGGYSLGSLLLLSERGRLPGAVPLYCIAPFIGFCREFGLGGSTPMAVVQSLEEKFEKNPHGAIQVFHRLLSIPMDAAPSLPYEKEALLWGLRQLSCRRAQAIELESVQALVGADDRLMVLDDLRRCWPACQVVQGCGHDYRALLPAMAAGCRARGGSC